MLQPFSLIKIDDRVRLFLGLSEVHTLQSQAIIGTPWDVPVPMKVMFIVSKKQKLNIKYQKINSCETCTAIFGLSF
jgi:hypothetical protein